MCGKRERGTEESLTVRRLGKECVLENRPVAWTTRKRKERRYQRERERGREDFRVMNAPRTFSCT